VWNARFPETCVIPLVQQTKEFMRWKSEENCGEKQPTRLGNGKNASRAKSMSELQTSTLT